MDCGPACLYMVSNYHGGGSSYTSIQEYVQLGKEGANLYGISEAAERMGFRTLSVQVSVETLLQQAPLPCIVHWEQNHFVVVTPNSTGHKVEVADPAHGIIKYTKAEFCQKWLSHPEENAGIALLLEPGKDFAAQHFSSTTRKVSWAFFWQYVVQYKPFFGQLALAMLVASMLQLLLPFLTQSIVDVGINTRNFHYIQLVLIAQLFLFGGRTVTEFIRSQLLLYIGTRINISILSDFWIKLMQLPVAYFDTKKTGDTLQRLEDHHRLQNFLTASSLSTIFSFVNLLIFSVVLCVYSLPVFMVFVAGSVFYFIWVSLFLQGRRKLDVLRFSLAGRENTATMQLVQGMQEIRLNNCERPKRWEWERLQAGLFQVSFKGLYLSQYQQAGAFFINESKNILITFFVAKAVMDGQLTFGAMLAIQYIIGQLNSPVEQLIGFLQQAQDAKMSLERLNEIHELPNEDDAMHQVPVAEHEDPMIAQAPAAAGDSIASLEGAGIALQDISFTYPGAGNEPVLQHIHLHIQAGKVTAIVGMSGSGKTTLLKVLLRFYEQYSGNVLLLLQHGESVPFTQIAASRWRKYCGSVLQDGFIFNDTIEANICLTGEKPDRKRLAEACRIANIADFIQSLPMGFRTKIGAEGNGISQGQRQRILIARAVYRNPAFLFFDEATNALDANNEKAILDNLQSFFAGRTVVVVAHRLSTVKNADNIIVLSKGAIVEEGTHETLVAQRGDYFELVKNQLELGN